MHACMNTYMNVLISSTAIINSENIWSFVTIFNVRPLDSPF